MQTQTGETEYKPGVCNIGPEEIQRRYRYGYWGVLLCLVLILVIEGFHIERTWRLLLCLPAGVSFTGLLQARQRFCLIYGLRGVFSVKGLRMISKVTGDVFHQQDRHTAITLVVKIATGTVLVTLLYYFMPVGIFNLN